MPLLLRVALSLLRSAFSDKTGTFSSPARRAAVAMCSSSCKPAEDLCAVRQRFHDGRSISEGGRRKDTHTENGFRASRVFVLTLIPSSPSFLSLLFSLPFRISKTDKVVQGATIVNGPVPGSSVVLGSFRFSTFQHVLGSELLFIKIITSVWC